ncbi:MAG TPA: hypothetical protein VHC43_11020 [Mycobacteriales bacterium]|nr:hypothetical protein [Mycobacteriales bacterium]
MIIAIGSDKGSPGASTLALLVGACWPGERIVAEIDPDGADLPYRVAGVNGQPLAASPTITTLAVDSRPGAEQRPVLIYTQAAACGVPLLVGETSTSRFARIVPHLGRIGDALAASNETVVVDLGRLHVGSPALPLARGAVAVVLVTRGDTASLGHLRERVEELGSEFGGPHRLRSPLAVVVRAQRRDAHAAESRVSKVLSSVGSPALVLGVLPDDPAGVEALLAGSATRRTNRSGLLAAGRHFVSRLQASWPELTEPRSASLDRSALQAVGGTRL